MSKNIKIKNIIKSKNINNKESIDHTKSINSNEINIPRHKKSFKNIKEGHAHYKFPGSFRIGSIFKKDYGILRSYSNGEKTDKFINKNTFIYEVKNEDYYKKFKINFINNNKVRLFVKSINKDRETKVLDYGLCNVIKLTKNYVYFRLY